MENRQGCSTFYVFYSDAALCNVIDEYNVYNINIILNKSYTAI